MDAGESWGGSATGTPPACCTACRYVEFTKARSGWAPTVIDVLTPMRGAPRFMWSCYHGCGRPRRDRAPMLGYRA